MKTKYKGILFIILSALCFAFMNMFVRLSGDLPSVEKSFFRNLVAFIIAVAMMVRHRERFYVPKGNWKYMLLRAICGTVGILCNFYAVDHLVLADASMLNKMAPFFAIICSYFVLKEKLTPIHVTVLCGAFIGSLLIIKPTFLNMNVLPSIIGLCGGLGAGIAYTMVRLLGQKGQNKTSIVLFFSGFSCLVTVPYLMVHFQPMSVMQLLSLLCAGVAAAGGQFAITAAYFHAPAKDISVYDYSQIIFAALLGFVFFHQIPDRFSVLGYVIIIGMAVWLFIYNQRRKPA